jgi:hypothetical protein
MKKAFLIGLGLPSLLTMGTVAATQVPPVGQRSDTPAAAERRYITLMPTVHAAQGQPSEEVNVLFKFPKGLKVVELLAIFDVKDGEDVARAFKVGEVVKVPPGTKSIELDSSIYFSEEIDLRRRVSGQLVIELRAEPNRWFGFWSGLGVRSRPIRLVPISN